MSVTKERTIMNTFNLSKYAKSETSCTSKTACESKPANKALHLCPMCEGIGMEASTGAKLCRKCGGIGIIKEGSAKELTMSKTAQVDPLEEAAPGVPEAQPETVVPDLSNNEPSGAQNSSDIFDGEDEVEDFNEPDESANRGEIWRDIVMMIRGSYEEQIEKLFDYLSNGKGLHVAKPDDNMEMRTVIQKSLINMSDEDLKDVFKFMKSNA